MSIFLTSSPCSHDMPAGTQLPCILDKNNYFLDYLKKDWKADSYFLIISADPDNYAANDEMMRTFHQVWMYHGLTIAEINVCDHRNSKDIGELLQKADFLLLGGGHVPTQNKFFAELNLFELIKEFKGDVMGISAGSMNCADIVYAQPEEPGESIDPDYVRFFKGLGLTDVQILPHYNQVRDRILDGRRLYEDITFEDSMGQTFYVLMDGSYIVINTIGTWAFGETYIIKDGVMTPFCQFGKWRQIK